MDADEFFDVLDAANAQAGNFGENCATSRQPGSDIFVAEILDSGTDIGSGSGADLPAIDCVVYSWQEMRPDPSGCGYVTNELGRNGTSQSNPAAGLCNVPCEPGDLVYMRLRGWSSLFHGPMYEIMSVCGSLCAAGSGSGLEQPVVLDLVTCVQVQGADSGSGNTTGSSGRPPAFFANNS